MFSSCDNCEQCHYILSRGDGDDDENDEGYDEIVMRCYQVAISFGVIREKQIYDPSRPGSIFTPILTCPTAGYSV